MTDPSVAHEFGVYKRPGRSAMRTAAVATVAFGMGVLTATAVLSVQENASVAPILASGSAGPDPAEQAVNPLRASQAADVASEGTLGDEPGPVSPRRLGTVPVEPDGAPASRPIRDVTVDPNVDRTALSQDRSRFATRVVRPVREAEPADERAAPEPALEAWAAERQNVPIEVPAHTQAEPSLRIPAALAAESSGSVAAPVSARVRSAVSMRSGPDKGTEVVAVVPAAGPVQIVSCDGWCEVVYDGRRGFIYKSFLDGAP